MSKHSVCDIKAIDWACVIIQVLLSKGVVTEKDISSAILSNVDIPSLEYKKQLEDYLSIKIN